MANIEINTELHFGTTTGHTATDWQIALDEDFKYIIDESINDFINVKKWYSPLPKYNEQGYYSDMSLLYARARIRFGKDVSNWIVMKGNQNYQKVIITEDGKDPIFTDSNAINMQ